MTEELTVDVPLVAIGESPAVAHQGGTLLHPSESVRVRALPDHLPQSIEYSIESLVDFDGHDPRPRPGHPGRRDAADRRRRDHRQGPARARRGRGGRVVAEVEEGRGGRCRGRGEAAEAPREAAASESRRGLNEALAGCRSGASARADRPDAKTIGYAHRQSGRRTAAIRRVRSVASNRCRTSGSNLVEQGLLVELGQEADVAIDREADARACRGLGRDARNPACRSSPAAPRDRTAGRPPAVAVASLDRRTHRARRRRRVGDEDRSSSSHVT